MKAKLSQRQTVKNKLGVLELATILGNVSKACEIMSCSRDSFYRFKNLYEQGGELALQEISRKKPIEKNRVNALIEEAVIRMALDFPTYGQLRVSNELKKQGVNVSAGGVWSIWLRHNLTTLQKRLQALEAKVHQEGLILTKEQETALEKSKRQSTEKAKLHSPGYLGVQGTYYVGNVKGIGEVYQQTFIDVYSKVAFVKLYHKANALAAIDILANEVIPFYEQNSIRIISILNTSRSEYYIEEEQREYLRYLSAKGINYDVTIVENQRANDICQCFHYTIQNELYAIMFRRKQYESVLELQREVDCWLNVYNTQRVQVGEYCYGKTPMQTFMSRKL